MLDIAVVAQIDNKAVVHIKYHVIQFLSQNVPGREEKYGKQLVFK